MFCCVGVCRGGAVWCGVLGRGAVCGAVWSLGWCEMGDSFLRTCSEAF